MMQLVYAVLESGSPLPVPLPGGIGEREVVIHSEGDLLAACSTVPESAGDPSVPELLAYAGVIEALHACATVLPLRYGCLLSGIDAVRELLRTRQQGFLAALSGVAGCVEMGLRLLPGPEEACAELPPLDPNGTAVSSGAGYLAARRVQFAAREARKQLAETLLGWLKVSFAGVARQIATEVPDHPTTPLAFHCLIRAADQKRFEDLFRCLQAERPERMLLTGPWPPYHFATAQGSSTP